MKIKIIEILFFFLLIVVLNTGLSQSNGDSLKIVTWNIQMLPKVFHPFTKLVRKKQNIRAPKNVQYLNASDFDIVILQGFLINP